MYPLGIKLKLSGVCRFRSSLMALNITILVFLVGMSNYVVAVDTTFTSTASGGFGVGSWGVAGDWDTGNVPTAADNVFVGGGDVVNSVPSGATANQLHVSGGAFVKDGGRSLTTSDFVSVSGAGLLIFGDLDIGALPSGGAAGRSSGGGDGISVEGGTITALGGVGYLEATSGGNIGSGSGFVKNAGTFNVAEIRLTDANTTFRVNHDDSDTFLTRTGVTGGGAVQITGAGGVTLTSAGETTFEGANTYSGGTTISGGHTLLIANDSYVGGGALTLSGGTLSASSSFTSSKDATLNSGGLGASAGTTLTYNGNLSGTGALTKTGAGTVILGGTNSHSGGAAINDGTLSIDSDARLGNVSGGLSFVGGTLLATGAVSSARAVTMNAGGGTFDSNGNSFSLSGDISGTGSLTKSGQGP